MQSKIRFRAAAAVLAALLVSCASAPPVDPSASAAAMQFATSPDQARIYVVRRGVIGTSVLFQVAIDGQTVGSLPTKSFLSEEVRPGRHNISIFAPGNQETVIVAADAGHTYFIKAELSKTSFATKAVVEAIDEAEGRRLVAGAQMVQSAAAVRP
jgi:hypothetical protein